MEMEVVSKKVFVSCIVCSFFLLLFFSIQYKKNSSYLYICNERDMLDMYIRKDNEDIIVKPQNIKSILTCMGRGMAFFDRSIELVIGTPPVQISDVLSKRYNILNRDNSQTFGSTYYCLKSSKTYFIIQKSIEMDDLLSGIDSCQPKVIVASAKYQDNAIFEAIESQGYELILISVGKYKKITL